jgi:hypothetical protein
VGGNWDSEEKTDDAATTTSCTGRFQDCININNTNSTRAVGTTTTTTAAA